MLQETAQSRCNTSNPAQITDPLEALGNKVAVREPVSLGVHPRALQLFRFPLQHPVITSRYSPGGFHKPTE
jgi:hypothetical protein